MILKIERVKIQNYFLFDEQITELAEINYNNIIEK